MALLIWFVLLVAVLAAAAGGSAPVWAVMPVAASLPIFLLAYVRIVDQWRIAVVLRFGRFAGARGPGFILLLPFERVHAYVDMRVRTTPLTAERALTQDTVAVGVDTIVFWQVVDPQLASMGVENYAEAVGQAALTSIREAIGGTTLQHLLAEREILDSRIQAAMTRRTAAWGVSVTSVDIKDVSIPPDLYEVMSRQAQAEREKSARVTLASAEIEVARATAEAAKIYDDNPTALSLRRMGLVYEMGQNSNTIMIPTDLAGAMAGSLAMSTAASQKPPERNDHHHRPPVPPQPQSPPNPNTVPGGFNMTDRG
jgi:regulator of protease activity HflC (stomatin/prohibitin superfamily)